MKTKKRVLLKLTGKILLSKQHNLSATLITKIISQIKQLKNTHHFGIVVGGGNILRGEEQGKQLGLTPTFGHQAGMLSTMINGLILKDLFDQQGLEASLLSAITCPQIADPISQQQVDASLDQGKVILFVGGTGAPFFTTDTNAVVRCLQIGASEVWKGTGVDGIYGSDPAKDRDATLIKKITYSDAISQKLGIMDTTAMALAQTYNVTIRVFNIFEPDALLRASKSLNFGSIINK